MSSVYSSPGSSRRVSHATNNTESVPSRRGHTSDGIEDLLTTQGAVSTSHQTAELQTLWQRRKSSRSTERVIADAIDAFHLDLIEAYEDEQDHVSELHSPSNPTLPPRTSSLSNVSPPTRALSLEQGNLDHRSATRTSNSRQKRPQPIRIIEPITLEDQQPKVQSARLPPAPPFVDTGPPDGVFKKRHRRHMTISESKRAARSTIIISGPSGMLLEHDIPPIPGLSPSTSIATSVLSPVPGTPSSVKAPISEDRIRRELEALTLQDGADSLLTHRYGGKVDAELVMKLEKSAEADHDPASPDYRSARSRPERAPSDSEDRSHARHRKSIVEYFGRRSPVDRLLDYYLDDSKPPEAPKQPDKSTESPPEVPTLKRKQSLARRMTLTFRGIPKDKPPDIPPLPPSIPAGMI